MPETPFYRIAKANAPADLPDARKLAEGSTYAYLQSAQAPHEVLEALGAEKIADDWRGLWTKLTAAQRDVVFRVLVLRTQVLEGRTYRNLVAVPASEVRADDEVRGRVPAAQWAGEAPVVLRGV